MLGKLLGPSTTVGMLRDGLDATSQRLQGIAHRVANVTNGLEPSFEENLLQATAPDPDLGPGGEVDLEREMVDLADAQIRFDASATLLQRVYAQIRASLRGA